MFSPKAVPGSPNEPESNFEYGQFVFDTLVLVSFPLDIKSIYRFVFATILLMELFFVEKFPLRGSIGKGDFCTNENTQIFLSNAFKRLRINEENQQWSGCILLEEVEELVLSSILGYSREQALMAKLPRSSPLHRLSIPVKKPSDPPQSRWCLNWSHFLSRTAIDAGLHQMSGDVIKQEKTYNYLNLLRKLEDDTQNLPPEFSPARTMKVMKARSGCRFKFEDEEGNGVVPGCAQWGVTFYEPDA
jgi:hypothetical protein